MTLVNLLRFCDQKLSGYNLLSEGDVTSEIDKDVGKKVFKVKGAISALNLIKLSFPTIKARYLYLVVRSLNPSSHMSIHIQLVSESKFVKLSLSNSYRVKALKSCDNIQSPLQIPSDKWSLVVIDIQEWGTIATPGVEASFRCRSIQLCASLKLRGVWQSDMLFDASSLPGEIGVPTRTKHCGPLNWVALTTGSAPPVPTSSSSSAKENAPSVTTFPGDKRGISTPLVSEGKVVDDEGDKENEVIEETLESQIVRRRRTHSSKVFKQQVRTSVDAESMPFLSADSVIGYSGAHAGSCIWIRQGNAIMYPTTCNLVIMTFDPHHGGQTVLHGHTAPIVALAASADGSLAATGQAGSFPLIRIWDTYSGVCLAILGGIATGLYSLDISSDFKFLLASGADSHGKNQLCVWDISRCRTGGACKVVARQVVEHSIKRVLFSPYDEGKMVSCGRENIRFWRIKGPHLPSCPVILNEYSRSITFTDLAFESSYGTRPVEGSGPYRHIFVASEVGTVLQVNYETRDLDCVFRLHDGPINSIVVNEGFCVTGSSDSYLRVWPLDFSDYFLEAKHEGPITSLSISDNGLQIAVGTEYGTLGIMDVSSHSYLTLIRSHSGIISDVSVVSVDKQEVATVGTDGTIRVWDVSSGEQKFEFEVPNDEAVCVDTHPRDHNIVCGFKSGYIRIFDTEGSTIIHEYSQHRGAVEKVAFAHDGFLLFSCGRDHHICVYNVLDNYNPIKMTDTRNLHDTPTGTQTKGGEGTQADVNYSVAVSLNGAMMASITDGMSVSIYAADNLNLMRRLFPPRSTSPNGKDKPYFKAVAFSADCTEVLVATNSPSRSIARYRVANGHMVAEFPTHHIHPIKCIAVSPCGKYVLSGGLDPVIKVWNYQPEKDQSPTYQSFLGHANGINSMHFSLDGTKLVSVGNSIEVIIWSVSEGITAYHPSMSQNNMMGYSSVDVTGGILKSNVSLLNESIFKESIDIL